jgi:pantoate--beta-alanine ligase
MIVARTIAEVRAGTRELPRPLGLVPTMGALHEGHLELARAAKAECASVALSIFVNPAQFHEEEDLELYPRDEARDLELAEAAGVDVVFAPAVAEMYPDGFATTVRVRGELTSLYEGAVRPGHFDGVTTVVTKLLTIVGPDAAFFGRKDGQQLAVVRRLVADLDLPVAIVGVETVREPDGLALSSRNAHLNAAQRAKAADLHRALEAGRQVAAHGVRAVIDETTAMLVLGFPPYIGAAQAGPQFSVDYVQVVDPDSFERVDDPTPDSLIIAAVRLGETRLIDNLPIGEEPLTERHTEPALVEEPVSGEEG